MKKFWVISIFMTVFVGSVAADSMQWALPEGVRGRLGKGVVHDIAFSPDGTRFAVAGAGIWLYDARTYEAVALFTGEHPYTVLYVVFSPDGKLLASCGELDDVIQLWDVETGTVLHTFVGNATPQLYRSYRQNDHGTTYCTYARWTGHVGQASFSPDGKLLANGNWDGSVDIWDVSTGRNLHTITTDRTEHPGGHPPQVDFRSDGQTLASYNANEIHLWDVETGRLQETIQGEALASQSWWLEWYHGQEFSPDRRVFASPASARFLVVVRDTDTGDLLYRFRHTHEIGGRRVETEVGYYRFSPDGQTLAISQLFGGPIDFWDVKTGRLLHTIYGHTSLVDKVAYSPDGRTLASNDGGFIHL